MREIRDATRGASIELGAQRGSFPAFAESVPAREGLATLRNATTTSNAPNSTIGAIAGCSPGIEPLFALSSTRRLASDDELREVNVAVQAAFQESTDLGISKTVSISKTVNLPRDATPADVRDAYRPRVGARLQGRDGVPRRLPRAAVHRDGGLHSRQWFKTGL